MLVAAILAALYYGFAILYYTQRAEKRCRQLFNSRGNCSDPCSEYWNAADAIYFATVTMTTVGYGDLKPVTDENMAVTLLFLLVGFLVRSFLRAHLRPRGLQPPRCAPSHDTKVPVDRSARGATLQFTCHALAHCTARTLHIYT